MKTIKTLGTNLPIMAAAIAALVAGSSAQAQTAPSAQQLMQMIQAQQKQLDSMKAALMKAQAQAQTAAAKAEEAAQSTPRLPEGFQFGGAAEVEMTATETYAGADSSDITLAKVEAYFDAQPFEYLSTHMQILYEDDGTETISLDEAWAFLGNTDNYPVYLQAGKWALPFGGFDTAMSTDPLTKSLGETKEAAVLVGFTKAGLTLEGFGYNGDTQQTGEGDNIDQFGLAASYGTEMNGTAVSVGAGYLSNITDSDTITSNVTGGTALTDHVAGWEVHGSVGNGPFTVYAGYMSAKDSFQAGELAFNGQGAKPSAWNLEAAYAVEIMGKETTFAATVQGTDEALALSLPESRYGAAVSVQVMPNAAVTAEYVHDEDYATSEGGTGKDGSTATLKLAAEF